jgi:hypothetical protein
MALTVSPLPGLADNRTNLNTALWQRPIVTTGDRQYAAWWDDQRHPIVAVRLLPDGQWLTRDLHQLDGNPLASPSSGDNHHVLVLAVDDAGRVHVAGNMHVDPIRYARTVGDDIFGDWTSDNPPGGGLTSITYPQFVATGNGMLLFFRDGSVANGDLVYQRWDGAAWSSVTTLLDGRTSGENPYPSTIIATSGEVHIAATWQDGEFLQDITHVVSRDDGVTWQGMDGTPLSLPIDHAGAPLVLDTSSDIGMTPSFSMDVDSSGVPHIAMHVLDGGTGPSRVNYAVWDGAQWVNTELFGDWSHTATSADIAAPRLVVHGTRVLVITRNNVDAPSQLRIRDITSGADGPILNLNLRSAQLPGEHTPGAVRLLVTQVGSDLAAEPLAILTVDLTRIDDILNGDVAVPDSLTFPAQAPSGLSQVAQAQIRARVTWLGCDLGSGRIIAELPHITGSVSRVIGRYTSSALRLPIPLSGPEALPIALVERATQPARTMLVLVVNDVPSWAGLPLPREGGTDATLRLGYVSIEGYLQHRFVRNHTWTQRDDSSVIAAGLLADAGDIGGVGSGIAMTIDAEPTGRLRDRTYLASDHGTVYDALVELMAVQDGPEWTIDPDWGDSTHTVVTLVARVRSRLGVSSSTPTAVFETTASSVFSSRGSANATYRYLEDHSAGRYANFVIAYGSGEGDDQPVSTPAVDTSGLVSGAPIWERHWQPSTSITDVATLDQHALAELARIRSGASTWQITARWDAYPRYGVDWQLGDDIQWQLFGHRHPAGVLGQGRAIGWEMDTTAGTSTPILQEP